MDLIDEQNVTFAEIRKRADKIARLFQSGPRGSADVHTHLACDELGKRRLAKACRAEEQGVVKWLTAKQRCVDVNPHAVLHLGLTDELGQSLRAKRKLDDGFVAQNFRGCDLCAGHLMRLLGGDSITDRIHDSRDEDSPKIDRRTEGNALVHTFAARVARRSAARSRVSGFLQNAKRVTVSPIAGSW